MVISTGALVSTVFGGVVCLNMIFGLRLDQCVSDLVQVPETSQRVDDFLSCSGIPPSDTVYWFFRSASSSTDVAVGVCPPPPASCTLTFAVSNPVFTIRRTTSDVSHISWVRTIARILGRATLSCYSGTDAANVVQCRLDVVYPAEDVVCDVQFHSPSQSPWTVSGQCNITKVFSSQDRYSCTWYQSDGTSASSTQIPSSYVTMTTNESAADRNYTSAVCSLTGYPVPVASNVYTYSVVVSPGSEPVNATFIGSNVVRPPTAPVNDCPTDYMPEFSSLNCTCKGTDLGSPPGTVAWQGSASARLAVARVTKDFDNIQYTCQLHWNPATAALTNVYTLRVAYGPYNATTLIQGPSFFETDGSLFLTLNCTNVASISPSSTFSWSGSCSGQGQTCTFRPQPSDKVNVTCTATNDKNNGVSDSHTRTITLHYPPQGPPLITGYTGQPVTAGKHLAVRCSVIGGVPPITYVSLDCFGVTHRTTGQSITTNLTVEAGYHGGRCICTGQWKRDWYNLTSEVTFVVHYPPEITSVTLDGNDNATVNESNSKTVQLSCIARARPAPDLHLLKDSDSELVRRTGGSVSQTETTLSYPLSARCENSAVYTCQAENSAGQPALKNVIFNVLCLPRLVNPGSSSNPPSVNFKGTELTLTFDLLSNPVPDRFSFLYRGRTQNFTTSRPARVNVFGIECQQKSGARAVCVLSIDDVKEDDAGYYGVMMTNSIGTGTYTFHVRFNETDVPVAEAKTGSVVGVAVGVSVGIVGVVVVVAAVVVWILRRRRRDAAQSDNQHARTSQSDRGYLTPQPSRPLASSVSGIPASDDARMSSKYEGVEQYEVILSDSQTDGKSQTKVPDSTYEHLRMEDVGLKSTYTEMRNVQNT